MNRAPLSFIISCEKGPRADAIELRVARVDSGEGVLLREGSFLLRCSTNGRSVVQRCLIRHVESGREAYLQVGPGLRDFINDCLLDTHESSGHA